MKPFSSECWRSIHHVRCAGIGNGQALDVWAALCFFSNAGEVGCRRQSRLPLAIPQAMLDYVGTPGKSYRGTAARFSVELRVDYYLLPSGRQIRRRLRLTTAVPSQKELYEHAERLAMAGYG